MNADENRLLLFGNEPVVFHADAAHAQSQVGLRVDDRGIDHQVENAVPPFGTEPTARGG